MDNSFSKDLSKLSPAQFSKKLTEFAGAFRSEIEARVDGFDPDPEASKDRVTKSKDDFGFFANTYFPHYIRDQETVRPSVFQEWLIEELPLIIDNPEGVNLALAAPRGEAKSTYMLIFVIWCVLFEKKKYIVYIMDVYEQAAVVVEAFKAEFETNPRLKMDFPKIFGRGSLWREGEVVTRNNIKLHARGAGQKIRGLKHGPWRPDAVMLDDIENDENVNTPAQRDKLEKWLNKAVENLGEAGAKFDLLYIGTILHFDSVLARTLKKPLWRIKTFRSIRKWPTRMDLWEEWEELLRNIGPEEADRFYAENAMAMEAGAEVSWPDKRPLLYLMKLRVKVGISAFNSEQQNTPTDENASFAKVTFWVQERTGLVYFGACDPSLGKKGRRGDPSAILIGAFDRSTVSMDVAVASIRRRTPNLIISEIITLQRQFNCAMWFFETVQFQEFLRTQLITEAGREGVNMPARPVIPNTDKDLRIEGLSIPVSDERIRLHSSQTVLLEQLQQWPNGDHDDGPDCLEMLWSGSLGSVSIGDIKTAGSRVFSGSGFGGVTGGILNKMNGY